MEKSINRQGDSNSIFMWNTKLIMNRLIYHARSPSRVKATRPAVRVFSLTADFLCFECLHHVVMPLVAAVRRLRGLSADPSARTGVTCEGVL